MSRMERELMSIAQLIEEPCVNPGETIILVVDDHPGTRAPIVALLELTLRGCNLLAVESAEQALAWCEMQSPALVIMDIALPGGAESLKIRCTAATAGDL